jgi:hypothetical protein
MPEAIEAGAQGASPSKLVLYEIMQQRAKGTPRDQGPLPAFRRQ